jgi:hypothetical protein
LAAGTGSIIIDRIVSPPPHTTATTGEKGKREKKKIGEREK